MRLTERRSLPLRVAQGERVPWNPILQKRTKIVATIGPASRDPAILRSLFVSRRQRDALELLARHARGARRSHRRGARDLGRTRHSRGPSARSSRPEGAHRASSPAALASVRLERGARFVITVEPVEERPSASAPRIAICRRTSRSASVSTCKTARSPLRIVGKSATEIETMVEFGGDLRPAQGINYPDGTLNMASVTDRDLEYLAFGLRARRRLRRALVRALAPTTSCAPRRSSPSAASACRSSRRSRSTRRSTTSTPSSPRPTASWSRAATSASRSRSRPCRSCRSRSSRSAIARASRSSPRRRCSSR